MRITLTARSKQLVQYKLRVLSILNGGEPLAKIGSLELHELQETIDFAKSKFYDPSCGAITSGFNNSIEVFIGKNYEESKVIRSIEPPKCLDNILATVVSSASLAVGCELMANRILISATDESSCILPHYDSSPYHQISLRVHVPLITSPDALGISFHQKTLEPLFWHAEVGSIYAFNSFEPHTVVKINAGLRAHLICDLVVRGLYDAESSEETEKLKHAMYAKRAGTSLHFNPNVLTHTETSFDLRNRLATKFGGPKTFDPDGYADPIYIAKTLEYIRRLAKSSKLYEELHRTT